jgi:tetratricopeptide (TPR) repeat protein
MSSDPLVEVVEQLYGYPLAAKMIAGYLTFESPRKLAGSRFMSKFQRRIAEFIVASLTPILSPLDVSILQSLAIFGTGTTTKLLMGVKRIRKEGLDKVQESLSKLSGLMLINQNIDLVGLPPMVVAYFSDQSRQQETYNELARDLAGVAWKECKATLRRVNEIPEHSRTAESAPYVRLTRRLLRIAEPAHRLLLVTQQGEKAKQMPYRLRGHLREMVFVMYQQVGNYKACIEFASEWLGIEPQDSEIRLYQARAYRQLREYKKAIRLLNRLQHDRSPFIRARVFRERGTIAYGDYRKIRFYVTYHSYFRRAHYRSEGNCGIIHPTKLPGGSNGSIRRQRRLGNLYR